MPTLKATVDRTAGTVTLTVNDRRGVQDLIRTDANGTRPVRYTPDAGGNLPGVSGGVFVDYEAALGGMVSYRLVHPKFSDLVWVDLSGDWAPRFVLPFEPYVAATAPAVTDYSAARPSRATFHEVIGRPDPLVVEGRMGSRRGTLSAQFDSLADLGGLEALLVRGQTVMYRQSEHPGMDMYFHVSDTDIKHDPETGTWTLNIGYVEIAFPEGNRAAHTGWTFAAAKAAYGDFTEMTLAYESFAHLALGDYTE